MTTNLPESSTPDSHGAAVNQIPVAEANGFQLTFRHEAGIKILSTLVRASHDIEAWLRQHWLATPAPFYASVDLRNAGFKLAPVDTNLFPAGFNNLHRSSHPMCIQAIEHAIERVCPEAGKVLLIVESHSRNTFYFENVRVLLDLIERAGFEVAIGLLSEIDISADMSSPWQGWRHGVIQRHGDRVGLDDFDPCCIILNNDLSSGIPDQLLGIEQPVMPSPALGWRQRLKSRHFGFYRDIVDEFSQRFELDPWLLDARFRNCGQIDFQKRKGLDCLHHNAEQLFFDIRRKYEQYAIEREPFVVLKADAGTYGMAVMMIRDPDEIYHLNRRQRSRMSSGKGGLSVSQIILQEGVPTEELFGQQKYASESVIYMIDHTVVGGFYRCHSDKSAEESLNAPGAHFVPLPFSESCLNADPGALIENESNRLYVYGVVARLALLAAAHESRYHAGETA